MSLLRERMISAMCQRGFSQRTHESYLASVSAIARYYKQSPDQLTLQQLQQYFLYLVEKRKLSSSTCHAQFSAIRFLFLHVLGREDFADQIPLPKRPQKIPELLTRKEVSLIINACSNKKHKMMLLVCYGCGLRVSELISVKVRHLDSERKLLRVEQGKGAKDRAVVLSDTLLLQLKQYWISYKPPLWLFPNERNPEVHLNDSTIQKVFTKLKSSVGIKKRGGIHSLRHAYATHQLESGLPIHILQQQMGHKDIHSTLRYLHWIPGASENNMPHPDLIAQLQVSL